MYTTSFSNKTVLEPVREITNLLSASILTWWFSHIYIELNVHFPTMWKVRKLGRDEKHPKATLLRNMMEEKDKEDYTTSVAKLCRATV